jgi:hypothetical protein
LVENKPATQTKTSKLPIPVPVIVAAVVVALALGAWAALDYAARKNPPKPQVLTAEARQYVHNLQLSNVEIKAAESYMKQQVVEITGNIGNNGQRELKRVEIYCVFRDAYGQVVLRERVPIVGDRMGPLGPGG